MKIENEVVGGVAYERIEMPNGAVMRRPRHRGEAPTEAAPEITPGTNPSAPGLDELSAKMDALSAKMDVLGAKFDALATGGKDTAAPTPAPEPAV